MQAPKAPSRVWPGMVFGLIALNFVVVGLTIVAASAGRSSHAVEPHYDSKALNWERTARQLARNQDLGWVLRIERADSGVLATSLVDRAGRPIADAEISVEAFHHAQAARRLSAVMYGNVDGQYRANLSLQTLGIWEFRFTVKRGKEMFTSTQTRAVRGEDA